MGIQHLRITQGFNALRVFLVSARTTFHLGYVVFKNYRRVTMVMKVLGSYLLGAIRYPVAMSPSWLLWAQNKAK